MTWKRLVTGAVLIPVVVAIVWWAPLELQSILAMVVAGLVLLEFFVLADAVGLPENTVSQALRLLRAAGAVRSRRAGRRIYYAVHDEHVRLVLDLARQHVEHGTAR